MKRKTYNKTDARAVADIKRLFVKMTALLGDAVGHNDHQMIVGICSQMQTLLDSYLDCIEYGKAMVVEVYTQEDFLDIEEGESPF